MQGRYGPHLGRHPVLRAHCPGATSFVSWRVTRYTTTVAAPMPSRRLKLSRAAVQDQEGGVEEPQFLVRAGQFVYVS